MSQIIKKFIGADQVGAGKIQLENDMYMRARNAGNTADVDVLRVNTDDYIELNSAVPLVPDVASSGVIGLGTVPFSELNVVDANSQGANIYTTLGTDADLRIKPFFTVDGDSVAGIYLTIDATVQALAFATEDNSDNNAVETAPVLITSGVKSNGAANTGAVVIQSGNSELANSGGVAIETGGAPAGLSSDISLATGGAADAQSQGDITFTAKRVYVNQGMFQFKTLAADPTDISYLQGDIYFNTASNRLRVYTGSIWVDVGDGATAQVPVSKKESITISALDITNGYFDLAFEAEADSLDVITEGIIQREGSDYSLSVSGGVTRVTWSGNWASIIAENDVVVFKYLHLV